MSLLRVVKKLVPKPVKRAILAAKRRQEWRRNADRSTAEVFSEIYRERKWGGDEAFASGDGTATSPIVDAYCEAVERLVAERGLSGLHAVDLGCGNFSVGSRLRSHFGRYTGVDIVPELVEHLRAEFGDDTTDFACLNLVEDELPEGDVAFVRQVLQHLANDQVLAILHKLRKYRCAVITEHHPGDAYFREKNLDKPHGGDIRLYSGSGVYLDAPPFDAVGLRCELILEVPGHGFGVHPDPGVIRTYAVTAGV